MAPGDLFDRLVAAAPAAAVAFGVLRVAADLVDLTLPHELGTAHVLRTRGYMLAAALSLVATLLLVWGLVGLYRHLAPTGGLLAAAGFGLAFVGAVMAAGNEWAATFVFPMVAREAPEVSFIATTGRAPGLLQLGVGLTYLTMSLGLMLLAASGVRRGAFPRWQAALLVVGLLSNMFLSPESGTWQEVLPRILLGVAIGALGVHALRAAGGRA